MTHLKDTDDPHAHVVYRCYDADDQLLYIGCTRDLDYRMSLQPLILMRRLALVTTEDYPNRVEARAAERAAIKAEAPLLNKQHNPTRFAKRGPKWVALEPIHPLCAELIRQSEPVTMEELREAMNKVSEYLGDALDAFRNDAKDGAA